ncbi:MAG: S9 family peptidase [Gammaproteobacteria bacterium]|nr:S9 family peptidase [Gammaproteobacteria bacterium]
MKSLLPALLCSALLLTSTAPAMAATDTHPFGPKDLVMMSRVGDPQLSPDANLAAFTVRATDFKANKGVTSVWTIDLTEANVEPQKRAAGFAPRWSPDGKTLYFLSGKSGQVALWRIGADGGNPVQASKLPLAIHSYEISPDGRHVLLSMRVFMDCKDKPLSCTRERLDERKENKATGRIYTHLLERHWDHWTFGRRAQLFLGTLNDDGKLNPNLVWLTKGLDANVPPRPWGGDSNYSFSPDGKTVYFDTKAQTPANAWSTNYDVYSVPADGSKPPRNLTASNQAWDSSPIVSHDGKTLYYLAMATPRFEADRFAIMAMDLASGETREVDPDWDRSAGALQLSADGQTLYTAVSNLGNVSLFAVDIASGKASELVGKGKVSGFSLADGKLLVAHENFKHPTDLYLANADGEGYHQATHFNAERLAQIAFGDYEWFTFTGWNGDTVHGYVMKPANYEPGKKYPVAFLVHGGPQGAWTNEFHYRWNPEVYAGAGFAVVAINFHGSVGYGQAFTDSISQHWGDRPLEDLKKGWAAALAKFDFLDGSRACALGASYGGYMVYWMAGVWNKPWKCFVDHDGVFDTRMMYYATDELWFEEHENGGPQFEVPENYEEFNPLNHVKDWRVPMLVIHSRFDFRIPQSQGLGAFTALQRQGIPSKLLYFPDESHWVSKPHNSLQWHHVVLGWIERWTGQQ